MRLRKRTDKRIEIAAVKAKLEEVPREEDR